jgi:hypothetical protein
MMPTSLPLSITGMCETPNSLSALITAPTERFASMVCGALVHDG